MSTLTANTPFRPENCCHKLPSSCQLTARPICCACQDQRPHAPSYRKYIDGVGFVMLGNRQDNYCWPCKVFWDERVSYSGIRQEDSRIPNLPGIALFLNTWHDWHRGYREVRQEDGSLQRQELRGQSLRTVEIGQLPRPLPGTPLYDRRAIQWVLSNEPDIEVAITPTDGEEVYIPEEDRLFDSESEGAATPAQGGEAVGALETIADPSENSREADASALSTDQTRELGDILERLRGIMRGVDRVTGRLEPFVQELSNQGDESTGLLRLQERLSDVKTLLRGQANWLTTTVLQREAAATEPLRPELPRPISAAANEAQRQRNIRVFGTVEDVQNPDYVSPLNNMFNRHWERFRLAEEQRRQSQTQVRDASSTQDASLPADQSPQNGDLPSTDSILQNMRTAINSMGTSGPGAGGNQTVTQLDSLLPPPVAGLMEDQMYIKLQCTVCLEQVADIALVPCGHLVMCRWCSERHSRIDNYTPEQRRLANTCPFCRGTIKQRLRIYGWDGHQKQEASLYNLPDPAEKGSQGPEGRRSESSNPRSDANKPVRLGETVEMIMVLGIIWSFLVVFPFRAARG